jgi:phosphoribosyl 1,2-cyclic phosphodiesterase
MAMNVHVLASGSKGNCYCIETDRELIFVDLGVGITDLKRFVHKYGENKDISCMITHEHIDHIRGAKTFIRDFEPRVCASLGTLHAIQCLDIYPARVLALDSDKRYDFGSFSLTGFDVGHDAAEPFGYLVETNGGTMGFLTDSGCVTKEHLLHLRNADYLLLESNYDPVMLKRGHYPEYLKQRIASPLGHLSNDDAMMAVASLCGGKLKHCLLGHVSEENNDYTLLERLSGFCSESYGVSSTVLRQKTHYSYEL